MGRCSKRSIAVRRSIREMPAHHWIQQSSAAQRLSIAVAAGLIATSIAWSVVEGVESMLIGWCALAGTNLVLAWMSIARASAEQTRISVQRLDQSNVVVLAIVVCSAIASLFGIALMMMTSHALPFVPRTIRIALGLLAVSLSWILIHTRFAFHYAHRYYGDHRSNGAPVLGFPGAHPPDYLDFVYFSFVVGMTSQVSDVTVNTRSMRRLTLLHGIIAFGFNLVILAMCINTLAAGLTRTD
jgi:uncharacterized membrane protein